MSSTRRSDALSTLGAVLVLALILGPIVLFAVGIVLGTPSGTKGDQTAAFFGAGDQGSPWLWVARGSIAFVVVVIAGVGLYARRATRRSEVAGPAVPGPAAPGPAGPDRRPGTS